MTPHVSSARALLAYALGMAFFAYAFVQRVLPSVMIDELSDDLAVGAAALGVLSGAYFYAYACMQIPVGIVIDRYGPRRLMSAAMLLCVLGSAAMALSAGLHTATLARGVIGAAVAFGFVGTLSIIARYFPANRFALMAGLLQSAGMLGAVLGQAPARLLVEQQGWRGSLWALALVAAALALLLWLCVPAEPRKHAAQAPCSAPLYTVLRAVLSQRQNWYGAGLGFGLAATMLAFSGLWAVPWMEQVYGYSTATAAFLASLNFIGNAVGSPLIGWWSDRSGRRKPVLVTCAALGLLSILAIVYGRWSQSSLGVLIFCSGLGTAAIPTAFATLRELNAPQLAGTSLGLLNMFVVGSGAVLQPLIGALLDAQGKTGPSALGHSAQAYQSAFGVLVAANGLALVCALLIRGRRAPSPPVA